MKIFKTLFQTSLLGLVALVLVWAGSAPTAYAQGSTLTGTVTSPDGFPLPEGTLVKLFDPDLETVRGLAQPDLNDGAFSLPEVPNGLYVLKAVPPESSGYTQSLPRVVSVNGAPVDVGILALSEPQLFGTVGAPGAGDPTPADVFVYLLDGQVIQHVDAPAGNFQIGGLPVGGYALQAFARGETPYWKSAKTELNIVSVEDVP